MKQREVQDHNQVSWQCVQAFAGIESASAAKAAERIESEEGKVTVVCTPSGGAQTVRLELKPDWNERMADEELVKAISDAAQHRTNSSLK